MNNDKCKQAARPLKVLATVIAALLASLAASIILSMRLLEGTPRTAAIAVSALIAAAFAASAAKGFTRQARILKDLCRECAAPLVYVPRRFTYACRARDGSLLCLSTANMVLYRIRAREEIAREPFHPWREGLNFYCVKPVKGKYTRKGKTQAFEGELIYIDPYGPSLVRAKGEAERTPLA